MVTISVVPENQFSDFDLALTANGRPLAESRQGGAVSLLFVPTGYMDSIQFVAVPSEEYAVTVSVHAGGVAGAFRLYVVGSGPAFASTEFSGAHLASLDG